MARFLPAAVLLTLVLPAGAQAATVSVSESQDVYVGRYVAFEAASGEANRVTVTFSGKHARVHDVGAPLTAGAGCQRIDAHAATCDQGDYLQADLGDGNDRIAITLSSTEGSASVTGGPGDDVLDARHVDAVGPRGSAGDTLDGGPGGDRLLGGPNGDSMFGGAGADLLSGGRGPDVLSGDGPDRVDHPAVDRLDGGRGVDTVTYSERDQPVVVDLRTGRGGEPGEGDRLRRIEDVEGGNGRDVLRGDVGPNRLSAGLEGGGGDVLVGRGGADELLGSPLGAVLVGGSGNDLLHVLSPQATVRCGTGRDTLTELRDGVFVPRDCDWLDVQTLRVSHGAVLAGRARFEVHRLGAPGSRCAGSVTLGSADGTRYGGIAWHAGGRRDLALSFALTAPGRAAARAHRFAVVRVFERCGDVATTWRIRL
jgi:Ca2+-binding RTX toxin-like protein